MTNSHFQSDHVDALGLDALSAALLDPTTPLHQQKHACDALYARCLEHLPQLDIAPTALAAGKALASADAARCVLDFLRTAGLVRAVDAAIAARLARCDEANVEVLYAGCGPIAPLALLLARRYRGCVVHFTLIDIHESSLKAAMHLFDLAGAAAAVRATVCADAALLRMPAQTAFDVLVVEVMQRALAREPQLAVLANLLPQCTPDVILVPQRVVVSATLAKIAAEQTSASAPERLDLGTLIELSSDTLPALTAALKANPQALPEILLQAPGDTPPGLNLMLRTRIEAMPGAVLEDYDSGLTYPLFEFRLGAIAAGEWLGFTYRLGSDPGFSSRRLESPEPVRPLESKLAR